MKKMRIRVKKRMSKFSIFLIVITLVLITVFSGFSYVNKKISPYLLNYAELETRKLATLIINRAISKQIASELDVDSLIKTTVNDAGEIQSVDFNSVIVNKVLSTTTNLVQLNLKAIEEGKIDLIELPQDVLINYDEEKLRKGIIYEVSFGAATGNSFLANIGPKIPVKFNMVGDVTSNIKTRITEYGINNALLEVFVHIEVAEQVILPMASKRIMVETDIPVVIKVINGSIPKYYQNGISSNSPVFSLPIE